MTPPSLPPIRVPVAFARLWTKNTAVTDEFHQQHSLAGHGVHRIAPGLLAFAPDAGDPLVVEAAFHTTQRIFGANPAGSAISALIFPGWLVQDGSRVDAVPDHLSRDLDQEAPKLENRQVHLTGHALWELEGNWSSEKATSFSGPSGRVSSIFRLGSSRPTMTPWRNPVLLGRATSFIERDVLDPLFEMLNRPACRVVGPLGCGKSRAVFELLREANRRVVWLHSWTDRSGGPTFAQALARELIREDAHPALVARDAFSEVEALLEEWWQSGSADQNEALALATLRSLTSISPSSSLTIVLDDLERARASDLEFIARLQRNPLFGQGFRLVMVGRPAGPWQDQSSDLPTTHLRNMQASEAQPLWHQLIDNLSMPSEVDEALFHTSGGCPWVLEDTLVQLTRRRVLRQLYGNFFFSGGSDTSYSPSTGYARHLEAELMRLREPDGIRALALADGSMPASAIAETIEASRERPVSGDWASLPTTAGILRQDGEGYEPATPSLRIALASSYCTDTTRELKQALATGLGTVTDSHTPWQRYQLLRGTPDAVPALLQAGKSAMKTNPDGLFDALREELENHRLRQGDPGVELDLLWMLLPLARRLARLRNLGPAIDRAIELAGETSPRLLALTTLKSEQAMNEGSLKEAEVQLLLALEISRGSTPARQSLLLVQLGKLLQRQGRIREARKLFENFLPNVDQDGNANLASSCRYHLGNIALQERRFDDALELHQKALRIRQNNKLSQIGQSLTAIGSINLEIGNYLRAMGLFRQAEEEIRQTSGSNETAEITYPQLGIGRVLTRLGDYTGAAAYFRQALELRERSDDQPGEAIARLDTAENHLLLGQIDSAIDQTRKAHFKTTMLAMHRYVGDAERLLGRLQLRQRQLEQARTHLRSALAQHIRHGFNLESLFDRAWLLEAALGLEDGEAVLRQCRELHQEMAALAYPDQGEVIDLRLYRGLKWLRAHQQKAPEPTAVIERAYRELYRKTELLEPEHRNRFLLQILDNRAVIEVATELGLTSGTL